MTHRPTRIVLLLLLSALGLAALPAVAGAAPNFVDTQVKADILLLQGYINAAAIKSEFVYPVVATVKQGGGLVAPIWPANPWTGKSMVPARSRGNYTYSLTATGYRLVGHLSKGVYVVTGGVPYWLRDDSARTGVSLIAQYVDMWARANGGAYPAAVQVAAGGAVGTQIGVPLWPQDPWRHADMTLGAGAGQYTYVPRAGGYSLSVRLADGTTWSPGH
jgi:hypothetical protein